MGGDEGPPARRSAEALAVIPVHVDAAVFSGCAIVSASSVVPFILTIDKAVNQAASGIMPLGKALAQGVADIIKRPHVVVRSPAMWLVVGVYGSTYTAANLIDVAAERYDVSNKQHMTGKLVGTTAVNMSASLVKDIAFAKMFSKEAVAGAAATAAKRSVPLATYGCFLCRDTLTIGAGFIFPPLVASALQASAGMERQKADKAAQLITPMAMQTICTPVHLLALNMYNVPVATWNERAAAVRKTCPESTGVRMFRFMCAYGIGGILNKELSQRARSWTVDRYCYPNRKVA